SNGTAKMSCSTKATRSAGVRVSRTTTNASPMESLSKASCSGSMPATGLTMGSGTWVSRDTSRRVLRDRNMLRQTRPTTVVKQARVSAAEADPSFLDGVVRIGHGAEHAIGDATQVGAVCLEALGQPGVLFHLIHVSHPLVGRSHQSDLTHMIDVTRDTCGG